MATQQVTGRSERAFFPSFSVCLVWSTFSLCNSVSDFMRVLMGFFSRHWRPNAFQDQHLCLYAASSGPHLKQWFIFLIFLTGWQSRFFHTQNHSYHLWKGYFATDRFKVNYVNSTLLWGHHELCCFKTWRFSAVNSTLNQIYIIYRSICNEEMTMVTRNIA